MKVFISLTLSLLLLLTISCHGVKQANEDCLDNDFFVKSDTVIPQKDITDPSITDLFQHLRTYESEDSNLISTPLKLKIPIGLLGVHGKFLIPVLLERIPTRRFEPSRTTLTMHIDSVGQIWIDGGIKDTREVIAAIHEYYNYDKQHHPIIKLTWHRKASKPVIAYGFRLIQQSYFLKADYFTNGTESLACYAQNSSKYFVRQKKGMPIIIICYNDDELDSLFLPPFLE